MSLTPLTRAAFLKPIGTRFDTFDVPLLGGSLRCKSLTEAERMTYELGGSGDNREDRLADLKRRLLFASLVDGDGNQFLTDPSDVDSLGEQDSAIVDFVFEKVKAHVGISDEDVEALVGKPATGSGPTAGTTADSESPTG